MTATPPFLVDLNADDLRAIGIPAPWSYGRADRVRFYELDALNHVNNTVYLRWFETLRAGYMSALGLSHYRPGDPTFVLRNVTCDYLAPMFLNDSYIVTARCESFRNTSFRKEYAVWVDGEIKATGSAVCVVTDPAGSEKRPLPESFIRAFVERDGAQDAR